MTPEETRQLQTEVGEVALLLDHSAVRRAFREYDALMEKLKKMRPSLTGVHPAWDNFVLWRDTGLSSDRSMKEFVSELAYLAGRLSATLRVARSL